MSRKWKFHDHTALYFVSYAVVNCGRLDCGMSGTRSYAANDHRLIYAPVWEKDKI